MNEQPKLEKLVLWLPVEDYAALEKLASQQYRPITHQAMLSLRKVLEQAGLLEKPQIELVP